MSIPFSPSNLPDNPVNRSDKNPDSVRFWDYIKVALQIGVLVWGAAMLSAKVSQLAGSVNDLTAVTSKLQSTVEDVRVDNARIDIRLDNLEKRAP